AWTRGVSYIGIRNGDGRTLANVIGLAIAVGGRMSGDPQGEQDFRTFSRLTVGDSKALEKNVRQVAASNDEDLRRHGGTGSARSGRTACQRRDQAFAAANPAARRRIARRAPLSGYALCRNTDRLRRRDRSPGEARLRPDDRELHVIRPAYPGSR